MSDAPERPDSTDVDTYSEIETEVDKHFEGSWENFFKAVKNPAEVLHFILADHFGLEREKFEAWAQEKKLPPDWVPRFYGTLNEKGELKAKPE
jgi:hypothetical protein